MMKIEFNEMMALHAALKAAQAAVPLAHRKVYERFHVFGGLKNRLAFLRAQSRAVDQNESLIKEEEAKILKVVRINEPSNVVIRATVGKTVGATPVSRTKKKGRGSGMNTLNITVGYMWRRKVYEKILGGKLTNANEVFVIKAREFRINVPQVRLYEVAVWNYKQWTMERGYIGQTKIGKGTCAYRRTREMAIRAARLLGGEEISTKIKGENS